MTAMPSVYWKLSLTKCCSVNRLVFYSVSNDNQFMSKILCKKKSIRYCSALPSLKIFKKSYKKILMLMNEKNVDIMD